MWLACGAMVARAEEVDSLPDPLPLQYVVQRASERRAEVAASRARAQAAAQRPAIVSALEDPMISPSIDHLPFMLDGVNASLAIEQRFPLSRVLTHRGDSARAEAARWAADSKRVELNVEYDAASAFFMLQERRGMAAVLVEQRGLAGQMVRSATARYASGTGAQADVLRAEMELARLEAFARAATADVGGAEAMLNAAADASLAGSVSGQLPLVSVVEAAQALWMAQGDQIMAEAELGLAWARLGRALGASGAGR